MIPFIKEHSYLFVLFWLVTVLLASPLMDNENFISHLISTIIFAFIIFSCIYATTDNSRSLIINLVLGGLTFTQFLLFIFSEDFSFSGNVFIGLGISGQGLYLLFFGYTFFKVMKKMVQAKTITLNVLFAGMVGYWILGYLGAMLFGSIVRLNPEAFYFPEGSDPGDLVYFAYVSLTTLGYGDILPITPFAKSLAVTLSLFGQLYLAIVVAILVGKYIGHSLQKNASGGAE